MNEPLPNKVTATEGIRWIGMSFSLFGRSPSIWIVMFLLFAGINLGLTMLPFLELLPTVLAPAFLAGFYIGCVELQKGGMLQIDHLFHGFKKQGRMLIRLGLFFFLWNIVIYLIVLLFLQSILSQEQARLLTEAQSQEQMGALLTQNPEMLGAFFNALIVAALLSIPLVMASWFSPALVTFQNVPPLRAMAISLKACNKNILPFLLYGILMLPMMVLAFLPLGLGLLLILPVIIISQFVSYQAVFPNADDSNDDQEQSIITL